MFIFPHIKKWGKVELDEVDIPALDLLFVWKFLKMCISSNWAWFQLYVLLIVEGNFHR